MMLLCCRTSYDLCGRSERVRSPKAGLRVVCLPMLPLPRGLVACTRWTQSGTQKMRLSLTTPLRHNRCLQARCCTTKSVPNAVQTKRRGLDYNLGVQQSQVDSVEGNDVNNPFQAGKCERRLPSFRRERDSCHRMRETLRPSARRLSRSKLD